MTFTKYAERGAVTFFRRGYQLAFAPFSNIARRTCVNLVCPACTNRLDAHRLLLMPLIDTNRVTDSALLFSHPLPYVRRTVLQAHAARFTAREELYGAAICLPDLPQV